MSLIEKYLAYADAFEESYEDDDWSRIAQYFTEDAQYTGEPHAEGREAVLAKLQGAVNGVDRLMDSRTLDFGTPAEADGTVRIAWQVTYTKDGAPDLVISGEEVAQYEGDRIRVLTDIIQPEVEASIGAWMQAHGALLQG